MNEILRCLFLFSHFFLSSSFLFAPPLLPLPLARSRFTPLSLALTNLTLVELFPVFSRSLSPTHYLRARTSSPPFPLGLIHTDQGCKCDVVYHCAVPSHWGGGNTPDFPCRGGQEGFVSPVHGLFFSVYYIWSNPLHPRIMQRWAARLNHDLSAMSAQMGGQSYMSGGNHWCVILQGMVGPPCQTE